MKQIRKRILRRCRSVVLTESEREPKVDYAQFLQKREIYATLQVDQSKQLDQNMFLLSTGVFGVTFSFISTIVKYPNPRLTWILILSWIFIVSCIVISLSAYVVNYYVYKRILYRMDAEYQRTSNEAETAESDNERIKRRRSAEARDSIVAEVFNIVNLVLLSLGFIALLTYVGLSFSRVGLV